MAAKAPWITRAVFAATAALSKLYLAACSSRIRVDNAHILRRAIFNRPPGRPLITVSNHTSPVDDPLLWAAVLTPIELLKVCLQSPSSTKRWTLGAEEICFTNYIFHSFFSLGRVIPISRGHGIEQPAMHDALLRLGKGDWVHVFVEGKINVEEPKALAKPIRWGVGRLVLECEPPPLIVPIVHLGMERVARFGKWGVGVGFDVDVRVGPVIDGGRLQSEVGKVDLDIARTAITQYVEGRLDDLYELDNPLIKLFMHEKVNP